MPVKRYAALALQASLVEGQGAGKRPTPSSEPRRHYRDSVKHDDLVATDVIYLGPFPKGAVPLMHELSVHYHGTGGALAANAGFESLDGKVSEPTKYGPVAAIADIAGSGRSGQHYGQVEPFPSEGWLTLTMTGSGVAGSGGTVPPSAQVDEVSIDVPWVGF